VLHADTDSPSPNVRNGSKADISTDAKKPVLQPPICALS
jgi:hypothetical protein